MLLFFSACNTSKKMGAVKEQERKEEGCDYAEKIGVSLQGDENIVLLKCVVGWLGVPYKYGGCDKNGTDCSCLIRNIYQAVYARELSRTAADMCEQDVKKISQTELKEGDLVFFKINKSKPSHVGIYLKERKFVHASTSKGVVVSSLDNPYYKKYFYTAGRVM